MGSSVWLYFFSRITKSNNSFFIYYRSWAHLFRFVSLVHMSMQAWVWQWPRTLYLPLLRLL